MSETQYGKYQQISLQDTDDGEDVCIGKLWEQKVYLHWSDVKDICTNAVSEAYEQVKKDNTKLKELLKECRNAMNDDEYWVQCDLIKQIDELLGEE